MVFQALQYFERRAQLGQELYEANPLSLKLEDGLAISYSKLGGIHQAMKQPQMARKLYLNAQEIWKKLADQTKLPKFDRYLKWIEGQLEGLEEKP